MKPQECQQVAAAIKRDTGPLESAHTFDMFTFSCGHPSYAANKRELRP